MADELPGPAQAPTSRIGQWVVVEANGADRLLQVATVRQPYLVYAAAPDKVLVARVEAGARLVVGRSREADLSLYWDPTVSTVHAAVERHLDLLTIEDLGPSTNGTFVNGQRVSGRTRLNDRDLVRCASTEVLVRCPVLDGEGRTVALPPEIDWSVLTPTERRVIGRLIELWPPDARLHRAPTTAQLGEALALAPETVRSHLKSIYAKLRRFGVEPTREALAEAASGEVIELLRTDTLLGTE